MTRSKQTGSKAGSAASKTLRDSSTGDDSKSAGGSALSQRKAPGKETSADAAASASDTLRDGRTNRSSKTSAGSALSQKPSSKKKP
jgi:hypothetical protein